MVRELRPSTFSSSSPSRSSARTGCRRRRGWTLTPTSTGARSAAPATGKGASLGGRPGPRLSPAGDGITVCECHNGFWMFSTDLTLLRRWPHKCPKTTKTGRQGRSSEFNLRGGSPLRKTGGEGEIRTLDGPVTHNGFRDRRLQPDSATSPMAPAILSQGGQMALPTGFEPAFSALTGPRVWPAYTTGPTAARPTTPLNETPIWWGPATPYLQLVPARRRR